MPLLIGGMGLWKTVLSTAAPALASQITISSLKLAWFSPIEIRGLVVRDPAGQPLAEVPVIRSRKTLLSIAAGSSDVGVFDVEEPRLKIVLARMAATPRDLLAKLPKSQNSKPSGKPSSVGFGLAVSKGIVDLDDQIAGRKWEIDGLTVDLTWPAAAAQAKTGKLAAGVRPAGGDADTGQLSAEFSWQPGADEKSPLGGGQSQIALQTFPTEIAEGGLRPLRQRYPPPRTADLASRRRLERERHDPGPGESACYAQACRWRRRAS